MKPERFWKAIEYLRPAIGRTPYWVWEEGIIPEGPGAFATNRPVPSIEFVKGEPGIFCAGLTNLILRHAGKRVPTKGNFSTTVASPPTSRASMGKATTRVTTSPSMPVR